MYTLTGAMLDTYSTAAPANTDQMCYIRIYTNTHVVQLGRVVYGVNRITARAIRCDTQCMVCDI